MKLAQVTLAVPDDIYADVMKGTLEIAGLVKDNNHVIRKHLPRVADTVPKSEIVQKIKKANILQVLKNNKGVAIGIGIGAAVGAGALYTVHSFKEKKIEKEEENIKDFQEALKAYLNTTKTGKLNCQVVDSLLVELEEIEKRRMGDSIVLSIPASQLNELINSIYDYTKRLSEANKIDVQVTAPRCGKKDGITNLQSYLEIQKQIFEKVA